MKRILIVAHVGETFGHVADALSIARALVRRGLTVEIAAAPRAADMTAESGIDLAFYPVRWDWSHNASRLNGLSSQFVRHIVDTTEDLLALLERTAPDLVLGLPGFASSQVTRYCGVPHVSVLHGIHLAPLIELEGASPVESAVLAMASRACLGPLNEAFDVVSRKTGAPRLDYYAYIESERLFVPQPGLPFKAPPNMYVTNFIRSSLGPPFNGDRSRLQGACYVTFGSGNRCDIAQVVRVARDVFDEVVVSVGQVQLDPLATGTIVRPLIASWSLAGRVAAVVSHGGVGTVGTFSEWGTPQMIIPTELTQAMMAIFSARAGIARYVGLQSFAKRTELGRQLPKLNDHELRQAMLALRVDGAAQHRPPSSGADEIAARLAGEVLVANPADVALLDYSR